MSAFAIVRDARGSLVHVRTAEGERVGCIEVGLYEIVRMVIVGEVAASTREGAPAEAAREPIVALGNGR